MKDPVSTDAAPPVVAAIAFGRGTVIAGRYRIEQRLGAGGGGTVWRCHDDKLDAVVALKVVSADGDLERWRREVAMARRIADRNVCRVHDLGETAELRFVTMELVEGHSLRSRIGELAIADLRATFTQIVSGVAAIHAAGVVHRDLKPDNIVVATDGRAVIVDFGLAREPRAPTGEPRRGEAFAPPEAVTVQAAMVPGRPLATVTDVGIVVGTPRYMSPEQAAGDTVDARTDVWALGLIAHELLVGKVPELGQIAGGLDDDWPGITAILRRCLAPDPGARYPDAGALHAALAPRTRRWGWLVAVAAIAAAAIVVAVLAGRRAPESATVLPYRLDQLTTTTDWPAEAPVSVALAPDGKQFAYTTGNAKLYVRDVAGGATLAWPLPFKKYAVVAVDVAGWLAADSLAIVTSTEEEYVVSRVGLTSSEQLFASPHRIVAAANARTGRVAVAYDHELVLVPGEEHIAAPDDVAALAWSPDGTQLAIARLGGELAIDVLRPGESPVEIWTGPASATAPLLAWLDNDRLAFGVTALHVIEPVSKRVTTHALPAGEQLGVGTAAHGELLVLRGSVRDAVQIRTRFDRPLVRAHAEATTGSHVAGWTTGGRLVFLEDAKLVSAGPAGKNQPWTTAPWPGALAGDLPDTMVLDRVIVHRQDGDRLRIASIGESGDRKELATIAARDELRVVRCAGDRAEPCMIEQRTGAAIQWSEFDPADGAIGRPIFERTMPPQRVHSAARSHDGRQIAIADGPDLVVYDAGTGVPARRVQPRNATAARYQDVGYEANQSLWVAVRDLNGQAFRLGAFQPKPDGNLERFLSLKSPEPLRWFGRMATRLTGDDLVIGVAVRDLRFEIWRAQGL
ncbi:MAG: serine/threonine-protein kinase [Kofleriaceae bacterium]